MPLNTVQTLKKCLKLHDATRGGGV